MNKEYSFVELWNNIHLANFNSRHLQEKRKEHLQSLVDSYQIRLPEYARVQLSYKLSNEEDIQMRLQFPLTNECFEYVPNPAACPRKVLETVEEAHEAELEAYVARAEKPKRKKPVSLTRESPAIEEQPVKKAVYSSSEPVVSLEERAKVRGEIDALRERIERELYSK